MKDPPQYINKIHDGEGKAYRYRGSVYPTLFRLARHPDRRNQSGLNKAFLLEFVNAMFIVAWVWLTAKRLMMWQSLNGSVPIKEFLPLIIPALLIIVGHFRAKCLMHYAALIDLKEKICPACGYPLTLEDNEENSTDALCTECGRRWTVAQRADIIAKLRSTPQPASKTDAAD